MTKKSESLFEKGNFQLTKNFPKNLNESQLLVVCLKSKQKQSQL